MAVNGATAAELMDLAMNNELEVEATEEEYIEDTDNEVEIDTESDTEVNDDGQEPDTHEVEEGDGDGTAQDVEEGVEEDAEGDGGRVHEGVAAPERRLPVVGERAGQWVGDRVEDQRDPERQSAERPGHPQDLVVIEQDQDAEGRVLEALGHLPDAERELGAEGDLAVSVHRGTHSTPGETRPGGGAAL